MDPLRIDDAFASISPQWCMEQWPEEIRPFAYYLKRRWPPLNATHVVELGVRHGGTSALWHQLLPKANVIGVDRIGHDSYQEPEFSARARQMEVEHPRFKFVHGDTSDVRTLGMVREAIGDGRVGMLFIDADHSYRAVERDYHWFGSMVMNGGFIAFHDIVDGPRTGGGVAKFWSELQGDKREFCVGADWGGIGVIRK
jgi:cephalosporin hydroxylase